MMGAKELKRIVCYNFIKRVKIVDFCFYPQRYMRIDKKTEKRKK